MKNITIDESKVGIYTNWNKSPTCNKLRLHELSVYLYLANAQESYTTIQHMAGAINIAETEIVQALNTLYRKGYLAKFYNGNYIFYDHIILDEKWLNKKLYRYDVQNLLFELGVQEHGKLLTRSKLRNKLSVSRKYNIYEFKDGNLRCVIITLVTAGLSNP